MNTLYYLKLIKYKNYEKYQALKSYMLNKNEFYNYHMNKRTPLTSYRNGFSVHRTTVQVLGLQVLQ